MYMSSIPVTFIQRKNLCLFIKIIILLLMLQVQLLQRGLKSNNLHEKKCTKNNV